MMQNMFVLVFMHALTACVISSLNVEVQYQYLISSLDQGEYATTYSSMAHTFRLNDVTSSVLVQTWYKVLSMNNIMSSQDNAGAGCGLC